MSTSEHIHVVATFIAKEGKAEELYQCASALIEPTRKEEGCIFYALHKSVDNPLKMAMIEKWSSIAALEAHLKTDHVKAGFAKTGPLLDTVDVAKYSAAEM